MSDFDYDVVVIGSGFGGSVAALRLVEKGYRVAVLEAGRRFRDDEFATTSWHLRDYLWAPALGCYGIQRVNLLKDSLILSGAGVGGGSLVYANTLYEPLDPFFEDPAWGYITDWKDELKPYYDQAKRMLGAVTYDRETPADRVMRETAKRMGVEGTFHYAPVGVTFGDRPGADVGDPYFGGVGPRRNACTHCGECMTGCRHNAKNTLVKNYLYLAERAGAQVRALTTVTRVRPLRGGGYEVTTKPTDKRFGGRRIMTAEQVVFAASTLGTQRLLHAMRDSGDLPRISRRLGMLTRTNSEALLGAVARTRDVDYSQGVAITSSIHPDEYTHIEPVRYGKGSNAMMLLQSALAPEGTGKHRLLVWARNMLKLVPSLLTVYDWRHWSERTVIALVMQAHDNSITTFTKPGFLGRRRLTTRQGHGLPNPTYIPEGHRAVEEMADIMGGIAGGTVGEPFGIPMTAHFMGGCVIGESAADGVIDPYHRIFGHPGLHVVDGSAVSANLGVNPSLTITAQAERAMALWPNKGEVDPRPPLGARYRRIAPVMPKNPVVPDAAVAALRLPIAEVN
ncbi:GMC oxidoreductase [uncultured Aeromicrobium sp.]|uniref:GMC oxidoreductase n=1 Tax=uncultured Aeromicrobium sp. TaxID=337820 RepID=UPI0025E1835D|nr:GMC family oxidoreductase [uncultured Aeromicrobium sp.]